MKKKKGRTTDCQTRILRDENWRAEWSDQIEWMKARGERKKERKKDGHWRKRRKRWTDKQDMPVVVV